MLHGWMMHGGHHEANADILHGMFNGLGIYHHVDPHFGQSVRSPGFGGEVTVAVFGHRDARTGHNKCGRSRDIQRALAVSSGANNIHCAGRRLHRIAFCAHHTGSCRVFRHGFAACAQRHQQATDLCRSGFAIEQDFKCLFGLGFCQSAICSGAYQRFKMVAHADTFIVFRKVWIMVWPCSDLMDSG